MWFIFERPEEPLHSIVLCILLSYGMEFGNSNLRIVVSVLCPILVSFMCCFVVIAGGQEEGMGGCATVVENGCRGCG